VNFHQFEGFLIGICFKSSECLESLMEKLYKISEAAEILNFSTRSIERWIAEGRIQVVRFGPRSVRINPEEIEFIRCNGLRESHQVCANTNLETGRVLVKPGRSLFSERKGLRLWQN